MLSAENKLDLAEPLLSHTEKSAHNSTFPLLAWQVAEADSAMGILLVKQGRAVQAYPLLCNAENGIREYPQAAMKKRILEATTRFERRALSAAHRTQGKRAHFLEEDSSDRVFRAFPH